MILNDTTLFTFNKDYKKRDQLLGIQTDWTDQSGGLEYVEAISIDQLEKLLIERFIDPNEYQNESPTTRKFYEFMNSFPVATAHGYAISPERDDYRVTIEGLYVNESDVTSELKKKFRELCKDADEYYDQGELYSWWD
tara:strand:- start:301 stop:714 length:414 start_codon:yes stop_codon:yes gene_type:complete